ncbi:hypothetical protein [Azospirillum sp. ST 5-10]|uniref:hypothetical protein n=1 Tax=unclassified Azospirillum TaxID=2630922 RepID=UPI003F49F841
MADSHRAGGAPGNVRDATLKDHGQPHPYGVYQRAGGPDDGRSAEDTTPVLAPTIPPKGWGFSGGSVAALLIVALLIALAAWAL